MSGPRHHLGARYSADPIILPSDADGDVETVTVTIDDREVTVPEGELVIRAAERLGIVIPRFCDHPLLDPAGACRQCIVDIEGQPKPATSCTTPVQEGMVVKTHFTSETARAAQEAQLEFLLINHPLDCPMCDKGGECPLQDQALMHGPGESRFIDEKRRYEKPVAVSPNVLLDRERCVLCARCTRFAKQISGDPFIELFERGALQQVAIYEDEPYESYFSGNVIQICPVGALTSASYRFRARPFDLQSRPSVCNLCSAGCNLNVHTRRDEVQRVLARTNMEVNEAWNCDKGRFAFKYLDHERRLREPTLKKNGDFVGVSWTEALESATAAIREAGEGGVAVLTGGRLADEDAYVLSKFARTVLKTNDIDFRTWARGRDEDAALAAVAGRAAATYRDIDRAKVVLLVGLDPEEEVPILYLRLRKAWLKNGLNLAAVGAVAGTIGELLSDHVRTAPGGEAAALDELRDDLDGDDPGALASSLADAGQGAVVLVGERAASSPGTLASAARLAETLGGKLAWVPRRAGARGALDAGLLPNMLPGGRRIETDRSAVEAVWGDVPAADGRDLVEILEAAATGAIDVLYLCGVDLVRDGERPGLVRDALDRVGTVIVQDLLHTETVDEADVVLPAAAAYERDGSFTNWEGRRQPFRAAIARPELVQEDWEILVQVTATLGHDLGFSTLEAIRDEMERLGRVDTPAPWPDAAAAEPSAPSTDDDRLLLVTYRLLLDAGVMTWGANDLLKTARPAFVGLHRDDAERLGIRDGDNVNVAGELGDVTLRAHVGEDVASGTVFVPTNSTAEPILRALGVTDGTPVRVDVRRVDERVSRMFAGGDFTSGDAGLPSRNAEEDAT